jgi:hypothetical protein
VAQLFVAAYPECDRNAAQTSGGMKIGKFTDDYIGEETIKLRGFQAFGKVVL